MVEQITINKIEKIKIEDGVSVGTKTGQNAIILITSREN